MTEKGGQRLDYYLNLQEDLADYLRSLGVPETNIMLNVIAMAEQMDDHVLKTILIGHDRKEYHESEEEFRERQDVQSVSLENRLDRGIYPVEFVILKSGQYSAYMDCELSMADRGFEKPAYLVCENDEKYLSLTPCEMRAVSRMDGEVKSGHLSSLSFVSNGIVTKVEFSEGGDIRIPLAACTSSLRSESRVSCFVLITVTCNIGRVHMPESTALLIFWL